MRCAIKMQTLIVYESISREQVKCCSSCSILNYGVVWENLNYSVRLLSFVIKIGPALYRGDNPGMYVRTSARVISNTQNRPQRTN